MDSVAAQEDQSLLRGARCFGGASEHGETVGEVDVGTVQAWVVADRLGELYRQVELAQTLVAVAQVRQVGAENRAGADGGLVGSDLPSER